MRCLTICLLVAVLYAMTVAGSAGAEQNSAPVRPGGVIEQVRELVQSGKTAEAEQLVLKTLPLSPNPALLYLELGLIYEQQGQQAAALKAYKDGLRLHDQGRRKP